MHVLPRCRTIAAFAVFCLLHGSTLAIDAPLSASPATLGGVVEGATFSGVVATLTDADAGAGAADFSVTIHWGDGTSSAGAVTANGGGGFNISGSHAYVMRGQYTITTIVRSLRPDGGTTFSATSPSVPQVVPPSGTGGSGSLINDETSSTLQISGISADQVVADVDVTVSINHTRTGDLAIALFSPTGTGVGLAGGRGGDGDNFSSTIFDDEAPQPISAGSAPFSGRFQPEAPLSALDDQSPNSTWTLRVRDDAANNTGTLQAWSLTVQLASTTSAVGSINVSDAALSAAGQSITSLPGAAFSGTVATLTDQNPNSAGGNFSVSINWGDSSTSEGTLESTGPGAFNVRGTHTYAIHGTYPVHVSVTETGGATVTASSTATVINTTVTANSTMFDAQVGVPVSALVATFTSANPGATLNDFTAVITWGDGSASGGVIAASAAGMFEVHGTHVFGVTGEIPVAVAISTVNGSSTTTTSTARVGSPAISIPEVSMYEGQEGTSNATFILTLSAASTLSVSVDYATANDSATAGEDYQAAGGTITFAPGETTRTLTLRILGDTEPEVDERVLVNFSNATNAVVDAAQVAATILNDDGPVMSGGMCGACGAGAGLASAASLTAVSLLRLRRRSRVFRMAASKRPTA